MRYALDVIEYRGQSVHFGGDTGYDPELFRETRRRFPRQDVAILPIAPIEPRDFMSKHHIDPEEAVATFLDLGARWMVPVHFDTFVNSQDAFGSAPTRLREVLARRRIDSERVRLLEIGEQRVFVRKPASSRLN